MNLDIWRSTIQNLLKNKSFTAVSLIGLSVGFMGFMIVTLFIRYEFSYSPPWTGFGSSDRATDNQGRFSLKAINPNVPGYYTIKLEPKRDYRPFEQKIKFDGQPLIIQLEKGMVIEGILPDEHFRTPRDWPLQDPRFSWPRWHGRSLQVPAHWARRL